MHPRIYDIISLIRLECPHIFITFVSNWLLLTKKNITKLLNLKLDQIHISLDGPDIARGHPQYEKAKANLRELALQKQLQGVDYPRIHFNYVMGKDNEAALMPTLEFGIEVGFEGMSIEPLRILEPMAEWDDYIRDNSIYNHLDTAIPIVDEVRAFAAERGIEIETMIPTRLDPDHLGETLARNRRSRKTLDDGDRGAEIQTYVTPASLKCDRPFKMLRVEMDGTVYMCPAAQSANLNVFETEPIEIWNSLRFRELRCHLIEENFEDGCLDCHKLRNRLTFDAEIARKRMEPEKLRLSANQLVDATGRKLMENDDIQGCVEYSKVESGKVHVAGWAADLKSKRPCEFIVAFFGDANHAVARPTIRRPDVANILAEPRIELCGFTLLTDYPNAAGVADLDLQTWAIDKTGNCRKLSAMSEFVPAPRPDADTPAALPPEPMQRQQVVPGMLEFEAPDGVRVRITEGADLATLQRVLAALRSPVAARR